MTQCQRKSPLPSSGFVALSGRTDVAKPDEKLTEKLGTEKWVNSDIQLWIDIQKKEPRFFNRSLFLHLPKGHPVQSPFASLRANLRFTISVLLALRDAY